jgi:hypothetical protein
MQQEQLHVSQQVQIIHQTFDGIIADLAILSKHNDFQHMSAAGRRISSANRAR